MVVVLSIAADPFTQQLIQTKQQVVYTQDLNTTVARATRFSKGSEYFYAAVLDPGELFSHATNAQVNRS